MSNRDGALSLTGGLLGELRSLAWGAPPLLLGVIVGGLKGTPESSDIAPSHLLNQFWENSSRVVKGGVAGEKK